MSPLGIKIILHVYCIMEPFPRDLHMESSAAQEIMRFFQCHGMIEPHGEVGHGFGCGWRCTERGKAYVKHLEEVRLPISKTVWEQP